VTLFAVSCWVPRYEWIVTDKYDPNNKYHRELKEGIEIGNSLPDIATAADVSPLLYGVMTYGAIVMTSPGLAGVEEHQGRWL
jgi:hypothetical protein